MTIHVSPETCPAPVLNAHVRLSSRFPLPSGFLQDAIAAMRPDCGNVAPNFIMTFRPSGDMRRHWPGQVCQ